MEASQTHAFKKQYLYFTLLARQIRTIDTHTIHIETPITMPQPRKSQFYI
jgi:hypothetical protein